MRYLQVALITVGLLLGISCLVSAAAPKTVWSEEAEHFATASGMHFGAAVVDDPAASGGKALHIPYQAGSNGWNVAFSAPRMELRGQVLFTFWLRGVNRGELRRWPLL